MKNLKFYLFNLIVILVVLSILEITCSFLLNNPSNIPQGLIPAFKAYYNENDRSTIQVVPECAQYDPTLFYTLRPGSCVFENREFSNEVQTNKLGLRDDDSSAENPDVISLGDSFAMGWGVDQDSSYSYLLEQKIKSKLLNAGMSSYGTAREMEMLRRLDRDSLQTIIIQYHPNDYSENQTYFNNDFKLPISSEETYDSLVSTVNSRGNYYFGKHISLVLKHWIRSNKGSDENTDKDEAALFLKIIEKNRDLLENINIIVFEINKSNENNSTFINELRNQISTGSYPDFMNQITSVSMEGKFEINDYFLLDNHINESGHLKLSEILYTKIK